MNTLQILEALTEAYRILKTAQTACFLAAGGADAVTMKVYRAANHIERQQTALMSEAA